MDKKEDYADTIKELRKQTFPTPFDLAYQAFIDLNFDKKPQEWFCQNASQFIEEIREQCWIEFLEAENKFTVQALEALIDDEKYKNLEPVSAIKNYISAHAKNIYDLSLSNTQSRRSRAGKEFESIIELLLIAADIDVDSQNAIGKESFTSKGLGKMVDFISPGAVHYTINKRHTLLISAKTTLRERWQEVPEELARTSAREMYLATLDERISDNTLKILYEANVIVVTTVKNKKKNFASKKSRVITFEELIKISQDTLQKWNNHDYSDSEINDIRDDLNKQAEKHKNHPYVHGYYNKRLLQLDNTK